MQYRRATPADAPALAGINRQLIEDEWGGGGMSLERLEARIRRWLEDPEYTALIFEEEPGRMAAYALVVLDEEDDSAYIRHFFVCRDHRGRGTGRQAMELLLRDVIPAKARITLDVLASNTTGHRFWRSVGFGDYAIRMERLPAGAHPATPVHHGRTDVDDDDGAADAPRPDEGY